MSNTPVISRLPRIRVAGLVGLCLVGASMLLGGCNNALKDENAALQQENAQLRDQNTQLKASNDMLQNDANRGGGGGGGARTDKNAIHNTPHETVIEIAGDVLFDSGQATLKSSAKKELDAVVASIKSKHSGRTVRIEGYTDSKPLVKTKAKWGSNENLSKARADAVKEYLVSKGIPSGSVTTVGMGSANPKSTDAQSRRVEVVIVDTGN